MDNAVKLGMLLKEYREHATDPAPNRGGKKLTQERLAELLDSEKGIPRTPVTISYWERGEHKIKPERTILVALIDIFHRTGGIQTLKQADELLDVADYRTLSRQEMAAINAAWLEALATVRPGTMQLTPADMPQDEVPAPGALPSGSRLPLTANPHFVGREQELRRLANELREGVTVAVGQTVAATGLGGIGKTQLAVEFAHRYGKYFPGGVFWFNFDQPEAIAGQIADTGGPGYLDLRPDFNELKLAEQLQIVQKAWQKPTPRLLIFDGCEGEAPLVEWRPPHGGCRIIITSRRGQWSAGLGVTSLPLGVLSREESIHLLQQLRPDLTEAEAANIAEELGDLPLALHLAGSFLAAYQYDISPTDYLARLQAMRGGRLLEHPSLTGLGTNYSPTAHEAHVARTFALSYERLEETDKRDVLAQALLARAAHFAPNEPIPRFLLQGTVKNILNNADEQDLLLPQALNRLVALGLVNEEEGGSIRLHQLVTEFVRGIVADPSAQMDVEEIVLSEAKKLDEDPNPAFIRSWVSHLQYVTDYAQAREDVCTGGLCNELGRYCYLSGEYNKALSYSRRGLEIRNSIFGTNHPDVGESLNDLGTILYAAGDHEAAMSLLEQSLVVRKAVLEPEHPDIAQSLINLGVVLKRTGNFEAALSYLQRAVSLQGETLGPNHPKTANGLNALGNLLREMGDYHEAKSCLERTLVIREAIQGPNHPRTANGLNNLGSLLNAMGDYEIARSYLDRALAIREMVLGLMHPATAMSLNNLSSLLNVVGDYEAARSHLERALVIYEETLGPDHPETAMSLNNLGSVLIQTGDYEAANACLERALGIYEATLGRQHPRTTTPLCNLGIMHQQQGSFVVAERYLRQALSIREKTLGKDHILTAKSYSLLGHLLQVSSDIESANTHYKQALVIQEKVLGPDHPDTADTLHKLGTLQRVIGNLEDARPYLERALSIRAEKLGEEHQETATTLYELGLLAQAIGDLISACNYFQRALIAFEVALGPDHDKTQVVRASLRELDET